MCAHRMSLLGRPVGKRRLTQRSIADAGSRKVRARARASSGTAVHFTTIAFKDTHGNEYARSANQPDDASELLLYVRTVRILRTKSGEAIHSVGLRAQMQLRKLQEVALGLRVGDELLLLDTASREQLVGRVTSAGRDPKTGYGFVHLKQVKNVGSPTDPAIFAIST